MDHTVAERKNWAKFGQEKGNKPGPDRATTTVGENVMLKLSAGNKVSGSLYLLSLRLQLCNENEKLHTCEWARFIGWRILPYCTPTQPMPNFRFTLASSMLFRREADLSLRSSPLSQSQAQNNR